MPPGDEAADPVAQSLQAPTAVTGDERFPNPLAVRGRPERAAQERQPEAQAPRQDEVVMATGSISATELSEALTEQQRSEIATDGGLFSGLFHEISERQHGRRQERWDGEAPPGHDEHQQDRRLEDEPPCSRPSSSVAEFPSLESEPASEPPPTSVVRDYLCFLPPPAGRLIARTGALPELGDLLDLDRSEYEVVQIGRSPLPDDQRPCMYLRRRQ
jgi:hypothetical protein